MSKNGHLDTKVKCVKCNWEGTYRECGFGHDDFYCPICCTESLEQIKEEEWDRPLTEEEDKLTLDTCPMSRKSETIEIKRTKRGE